MTQTALKFGILGAGSIGTYIGAHLLRAGIDTVLVGREKLAHEIQANGLRITNLTGEDFHLKPEQVPYTTDTAALADRDIVLVTLKSAATESAAHDLKQILSAQTTVVSFQNGVRNADVLRSILTQAQVLAGMVPYNVVWKPGAHFHCGTSGALTIEEQGAISAVVVSGLHHAGLEAKTHTNLSGVLWGKLIFNLNNPINALAGIPLREELQQPAYRRIFAAAIAEALSVLQQSGIHPVPSGGLLPSIAPFILRLPNFLFFRVAANMIKIDPQARSSMWEDLQRGRKTEVDYITGEIVSLAQQRQLTAPINTAITALIHEAENQIGSPAMSAAQLAERIGAKHL